MVIENIGQLRLQSQLISDRKFETPEEVVAWMGAMQAQDFYGVKWSIGLRLNNANVGHIDEAIRERKIIRTWPMRGTLHFVAAPDLRWMLDLLAPRILATSARRNRELELDEQVFSQTKDLLINALGGKKQLTRQALYEILESSKIATQNQRGIHILQRHSLEGLIGFGQHDGRQPTFMLIDEWIPKSGIIDRNEALQSLALRYFTSHGPATLRDFIWWSGLTAADARKAVESLKNKLVAKKFNENEYWFNPLMEISGLTESSLYLLPGYDEYILGYTNRSDVLEPKHTSLITPGGGYFIPTLVIAGKIAGTWKTIRAKGKTELDVHPFSRLTSEQKKAVKQEEKRFKNFLIPSVPA